MKILKLTLNKKPFDVIITGVKNREYRKMNEGSKIKIGNRGIDTKSALYGPDHKTIHNIIDYELKTDPNTAFGHLEQLKNDPVAMSSIDNELMAKKLVAAANIKMIIVHWISPPYAPILVFFVENPLVAIVVNE